jgi:hypothetical protein
MENKGWFSFYNQSSNIKFYDMPTLISEKPDIYMSYNGSCDSWGCDRGCRSTDYFIAHYSFIPKFYLYDEKIENTEKSDYREGVYCDWCMNHKLEATKNKNGKPINREKRIRGCWDKDDYGYLENTDCDFCGEISSKLKLRLSEFTTNCEYNGIRNNNSYFIAICNKCTKMNPKQVFKLFNTIEEYNVYALSKDKSIKPIS